MYTCLLIYRYNKVIIVNEQLADAIIAKTDGKTLCTKKGLIKTFTDYKMVRWNIVL